MELSRSRIIIVKNAKGIHMNKLINTGDHVTVYFGVGVNPVEGTVEYIPQATGDSWHIINNAGDIHYVQTFAVMTKINDW